MRRYYRDGDLVGGQVKIAKVAPPKDKITGADFKALKRKSAMGGGIMRKGYLAGGQSKLDIDGDGKITGKDFAMLRNKKKKKK